MPSYGETLEEMSSIHIEDNGERLVEVLKLCPEIRYASDHPKFPGATRTCWARETVAKMLCEAQEHLPPGLHLEVQDAYRRDDTQQMLFTALYEELRIRHPGWTLEKVLEHTSEFVASPFISVPPPHTTGGAVDVTLVHDSGEMLDMTSPQGWDEASAPTSFPGISKQARANRRILIEAMSRAGFSNYLGEWWHWSYGDSGWALRAGLKTAIYGKVVDAPHASECPAASEVNKNA